MRRDVALFDVDTRQPSETGGGLVFRPRVEALAGRMAAMLDYARDHDILTVCTACLNAGLVPDVLPADAAFVPADADAIEWRRRLGSARSVWIEKRTCGSPEANVRLRAFDLFHANPHMERVLRELGIPHYVLFGDSACFCVRSTAEGLIRLGLRVTLTADAIGPGTETEQDKRRVLDELAAMGASVCTAGDFLARGV